MKMHSELMAERLRPIVRREHHTFAVRKAVVQFGRRLTPGLGWAREGA